MLGDEKIDQAVKALADVVLEQAVQSAVEDTLRRGGEVDEEMVEKINSKLSTHLADHIEEALLTWIAGPARIMLIEIAGEVLIEIMNKVEEAEKANDGS